MATHEDQLEQNMSQLNIGSYSPLSYSPIQGKKPAPLIPPKPKKPIEADVVIYANCSNIPSSSAGNSNSHVYSNYLPPGGEYQQQAPPPPPLPPSQSLSSTKQPTSSRVAPQHSEDIPAPVSPGSSSTYATTQSSYATFRPQSSASSYDTSSIYEPITPRPPSQMSNRSTYSTGSGGSSLYSSYYPPGGRIRPGATGTLTRNMANGKEAEVDHLTDLLVQSMENSGDPDFFDEAEEVVIGMCHKCGERVLGEGSGCTAMDQVYHIRCFTCHICQKELRGKPFYAMDGKPYCEEDYLNTLEKCCVCNKPILDRILRATGKPYHPGCFSCVMCGKCLDGIPFTVDATNRIHCIDDFHKKFAPRCCVCKQPIMPEPGQEETVRVVALDRSFHVNCYRCEDCGLLLSSEAEGRGCYPLDDHILCRSCNAKRVQALTSRMTTEL